MHKNPPLGRPSLYDPKYCEEVGDLFAQGWSVYQIVRHWRISVDTFYQWIKVHPEFSEAIQKGRDWSRGWWEGQALENLHSPAKAPFNAGLWWMSMKSRFRMADDIAADIDFGTAKTPNEKAQKVIEALSSKKIAPSQANNTLEALKKANDIQAQEELIKRVELLELKHVKP